MTQYVRLTLFIELILSQFDGQFSHLFRNEFDNFHLPNDLYLLYYLDRDFSEHFNFSYNLDRHLSDDLFDDLYSNLLDYLLDNLDWNLPDDFLYDLNRHFSNSLDLFDYLHSHLPDLLYLLDCLNISNWLNLLNCLHLFDCLFFFHYLNRNLNEIDWRLFIRLNKWSFGRLIVLSHENRNLPNNFDPFNNLNRHFSDNLNDYLFLNYLLHHYLSRHDSLYWNFYETYSWEVNVIIGWSRVWLNLYRNLNQFHLLLLISIISMKPSIVPLSIFVYCHCSLDRYLHEFNYLFYCLDNYRYLNNLLKINYFLHLNGHLNKHFNYLLLFLILS